MGPILGLHFDGSHFFVHSHPLQKRMPGVVRSPAMQWRPFLGRVSPAALPAFAVGHHRPLHRPEQVTRNHVGTVNSFWAVLFPVFVMPVLLGV